MVFKNLVAELIDESKILLIYLALSIKHLNSEWEISLISSDKSRSQWKLFELVL